MRIRIQNKGSGWNTFEYYRASECRPGHTPKNQLISVNEAISVSKHRTPTYQFQLAMVSLAAHCAVFDILRFTDLGIGVSINIGSPYM